MCVDCGRKNIDFTKPGTKLEKPRGSEQNGAWTTRESFRTAPATDEAAFTFIAGSDTKGGWQVMIDLLKMFERDGPRFMIYTGDAPHTGGLSPHWNRWFQAVEPFESKRPIMQSVGNHEVGGDPNLANFKIFNALPANSSSKAYYSFDYDPVHFVCLDTESGLHPEQVSWPAEDLATTRKPWKVTYFHSPPFSSGTEHGSNEALRGVIVAMVRWARRWYSISTQGVE